MHTTELSSGQINGRDTIRGRGGPNHADIGHDLRTLRSRGSKECSPALGTGCDL
jgi:hypothetical protein